jgi:hypothetical protein
MSCAAECFPVTDRTTIDRLDYAFDWTDWLTAMGLTAASITGYSFEVVGDPLLILAAQARDGALCVPWLEDGTDGVTAELRCTLEGMNGPEPYSVTRSRLIATRLSVGTAC